MRADEKIRKVYPDISTTGAYTIFLSIDTALTYSGKQPHVPIAGGDHTFVQSFSFLIEVFRSFKHVFAQELVT